VPGPAAWAYPVNVENNLLALTDDALWSRSTVFVSVRPERDRLAAGEDPAEVLGKEAVRIPLSAVYRVELDRRRDDLVVHYQQPNEEGKPVNRSREFALEDRARRDEIFDALRERLGPGWHVREHRPGPLAAVWIGVFGVVVSLIGLYLLLGVIHWLQGPDPLEGFRGRIVFALVRLVVYLVQGTFRALGFVADLIAYAAAAFVIGVSVWGAVSRFRTPPLMWYLEKGEASPLTPGSP
jgi:hypothetical protein